MGYNFGMTMDEFLGHMADILETPRASLRAENNLADLEGWNSMAMVSFIAFADEQGQTLSPKKIAPCVTVADLAKLTGVNG